MIDRLIAYQRISISLLKKACSLVFDYDNRQIIRKIINMNSIATFFSSKLESDNPEVQYVKQLTPKRWKQLMIDETQKMKQKHQNKINLLSDIKTIVMKVPDQNYIQSVLQIQPFKPEFIQEKFLEVDVTESTVASTIAKAAKFKGQTLKQKQKQFQAEKITEKTLIGQFNKNYHPYYYIIKNFSRFLQLKFKHLIDNKGILLDQVSLRLRSDIQIFIQFMRESSAPYLKMFKFENNQEGKKIAVKKMAKFIQSYILENEKINSTVKKIMLYSVRKQYNQFIQKNIKNLVTPQQFDIHPQFQIQGSFIRSINSLIQFSQCSSHMNAMKKLIQFRSNILKDIDQYYKQKQGQSRELQLNAEIQIQIIRYIVAKLKNWMSQIYAQLKCLQVMCGQEQIAYKYQQISFMYSQLLMAFEIIGIVSN